MQKHLKKLREWMNNPKSLIPLFHKLMRKQRNKNNQRLVITEADNRLLFSILRELGCFKFFSTNNGKIIGVSQVIAFLSYGYKALANGFTAPKELIQCHHINSRPDDNRPENLVFVSLQDHVLVSSCTNTPFYGRTINEASTPFNRCGEEVKNPIHFLSNIIKETLDAVSLVRSGSLPNVSLIQIIMALPKDTHRKPIHGIMPVWMNQSILWGIHTNDERLRYRG